MNNYKVALYIRLSKEDINKEEKENSESIENQKQLLLKYVNENNYELYDIYIDDGYTGTNFNRPSFMRMISDIDEKKVNMVIVKDLSRLGRDYILTGYYTEMWFPKNKVRFVSLLDSIDSLKESNELMPFKSLINDMYSKDNSKKIKAALRIKQQLGKWVGGCPPFGYMSDPQDKNHLVINNEEKNIVYIIFMLFLKGKSFSEISNYLFLNNIDSPNVKRGKRKNTNNKWSTTTIKSILKNQLYTGDMVQNRRKKINYKLKSIVNNSKEEWIIIPNTHEPIVTKEMFNEVEDMINRKINNRNKSNSYLLSGLIYCYECKKRMTIQIIKNKRYLICNTYKKNSKCHLCTTHSNGYDSLEKRIIMIIKSFIDKKMNQFNIDRSLIIKLIRKIEIHNNKQIDVYFNFTC